MFSEIVVRNVKFGINKIAFGVVLSKEMEGRHELYIWSVEVSNFVFEIFDQFERRKSHDEVLYSPLPVFLGNFVSTVHYLRIDVATHVY
jgi:hypothetical protein